MPDSDTMGWKLLDAVSTPNLESFARCLTPYRDDHGKCAIDYLRDSIVEAVIKNHPNATREKILEGMDAMGF